MIQNLKDEAWMIHPKYDWMAASNYGRIKSIERDVNGKCGSTRHLQEQLINPSPNNKGYLQFDISKKKLGIDDHPYAHRFIYECFHQRVLPKDRKLFQINHIDENPSNNQIENLELVTAKENINHGSHNERVSKSRTNNPKISKQVAQYKLNGELVKIWKSTKECGRNGFNQSAVAACCRGEYSTYKINIYKNFIWKYIESES